MADVRAAAVADVDAIAGTVGARAPVLGGVIRTLVVAGSSLNMRAAESVSTPPPPLLKVNAPARTRDIVLNFGEEMYHSFGELRHTVRIGETAFETLDGQPLFDSYASYPPRKRAVRRGGERDRFPPSGSRDLRPGSGRLDNGRHREERTPWWLRSLGRTPTLRAVLYKHPTVLPLADD